MTEEPNLAEGSAEGDSDVERYATLSNGLFPRFVLVSFLLTLGLVVIEWSPLYLGPPAFINGGINPAYQNFENLAFSISYLYFPFAFFLLFYLASRSLVNLGRYYAALALSIFVGAAIGIIPAVFIWVTQDLYSTTFVWDLAQLALTALSLLIQVTLAGFAAVFASFNRSA